MIRRSNPVSATTSTPRRGLAVMLICGGVLLSALLAALIGHSQNWGREQEPTAAQSPPAAAPPADDAPGGQAPPAAPGDKTKSAKPDWRGLKRQNMHGAQLPVSGVHGPKQTSAAAASGFSHDLGGAVLSAVHLATRVSPQVGPKIYGPNTERMTGDPADVTAFITQLDADYAKARGSSGVSAGEPLLIYAQTIGYTVPTPVDAKAKQVTVHLLSRGAGSGGGEVLVSIPVTVVWSNGDWRLKAPPGGKWAGQAVAGTDGYTLFPAKSEDGDSGAGGR